MKRRIDRVAALLLVAGCATPRCPPAQAAAATPVLPVAAASVAASGGAGFTEVVRSKNYVVELGASSLEVDPDDGGRIVAFSLAGRSVVLPRAESYEAYGSSFWTSPQSDWSWPPPVELDRAAWETALEGQTLRLRSGVIPRLGLAADQLITPVAATESVAIEYVLHNRGAAPRRVAPWQNTRVRPRGLTFFPSRSSSLPQSTLKLAPEAGVVWLRHDPATMRQSAKAFNDGSEGWLAHVDGDLLFVKVFPDIPPEQQAPGEAEIEIYVHETGQFVEMEQQGAYVEIAPGASSSWRVSWMLRRLPAELARDPRRPELVEHVRRLVANLGPSR